MASGPVRRANRSHDGGASRISCRPSQPGDLSMSPTIAARRPAAVDYERTLILSRGEQPKLGACCASAWPAAYESEAHGRPGSRGIDGGHCRISLPRRRYGPQYRTRDCRLRGGMVRLLARAMAYEA